MYDGSYDDGNIIRVKLGKVVEILLCLRFLTLLSVWCFIFLSLLTILYVLMKISQNFFKFLFPKHFYPCFDLCFQNDIVRNVTHWFKK